ncbi:MAG: hypothetical protein IJI41_06050 [Anaerolineaceae bacterium]|nr:hypothetical protein [Anaerolineaceae bacterium]
MFFSSFSRYINCFFILILLFTLGMIAIYQIPNNYLEPQYTKSIRQLDKEEDYASFLFDTDASILDNFTDKLMINTCHKNENTNNSIEEAFSNNGYPRYWHGYLIVLRPILTQFTYQQIRYINMFFLLISFCLCFSGIQQRINSVSALGFSISIIACFIVFISESLQYFSVFIILFITLLILIYIPYFKNMQNTPLLLFAVGIITNFFDLLTAPLLTLGIPLTLIIAQNYSINKNMNLRKQFRCIFKNSISWGVGYCSCWLSKWAISSLILKTNIFWDAFRSAQFRIKGNENYPLDRKIMLKLNFETYFFAKGHKPAFILLVLFLIILFIFSRYRKKNWINIIIPSLFIGFYPYFWYLLFANHSQMHYFYTYRIQAITVFAIFTAMSCAIDWKIFFSKILKHPDQKKMEQIHYF